MEKKGIIFMDLILISFVLLISLAFSSVIQTASAAQNPNPTPVISVLPASIEKSHGDTFTIEIKVDPKGSEIYGVEYDLDFDNSLLKALTQTQGTFLSQDGMNATEPRNEINNTIGKLEYLEFRGEDVESGVTNPGVLTSISFEVIGTSGTSDLNLSNVTLIPSDIDILETEINSGECIIGEVTGEPAATATPTGIPVDETPMPTETPVVTPSPAVSPALTPAASPTPTPVMTPTPTMTPSEEEKGKGIPGFEVAYAIMAFFILFMLLRSKKI